LYDLATVSSSDNLHNYKQRASRLIVGSSFASSLGGQPFRGSWS